MIEEIYLNSLKSKYNYSDKTIRALGKIIPSLIEYYGFEYKEMILDAINSCEIIPCSSKQTISKIKKEVNLSIKNGISDVASIEIKGSEASYISDVKISYDEESNKFNIDEIKRVIATSHTYNYDSPKGLEVLTYALCKLIKSYKDEFVIDENILIKRTGLELEKRHIVKDENDIYLNLISHEGHGLEEGFNIYDTSKIVSLILNYEYKCYDYDSIFGIANILKDRFKLKDKINRAELTGNITDLKSIYEEKFEDECDICLFLENEMFISVTREDKNEIASKINEKLNKDIFTKLVDIYENKIGNKKKIFN